MCEEWIQVIRAYLRSAHPEGLPQLAGGTGAPYLAQLVPELGALRSPAPAVPAPSEHARTLSSMESRRLGGSGRVSVAF